MLFPFIQDKRVSPHEMPDHILEYELTANSLGSLSWKRLGWRSDDYLEWNAITKPGEIYRD